MKKAITRTIVRLAVLALVIAIGYSFFGKVETVKHDPVLADSNGNVITTMHNIDNMEVVTLDVPESTEAPVVEETMPEVPAPILWDENVDLVPYYHEQDANMMSYLLYTPTNIQEGQKLPLLIWLHGSGEKNVDEATFRTRGLPAVLESMELTPNAFILCPQLDGAYDLGAWNNEGALVSVSNLVNYIVANNPAIDTENISLSGHSLGGTGALYMAQSMDYVNKVAPMSSYTARVVLPIGATAKFFVGSTACGEDGTCVQVANDLEASGYEVFFYDCGHGALPATVFAVNAETGESDVLTWLLTK